MTRLNTAQTDAWRALHATAVTVDRTSRMRMIVIGEKARAALGGLLTNDVASLSQGRGMRAAALTPKGRVIALLRVVDRGDDLLVDCDAAAGAGFTEMIRKFVNPRLARHTEITAATGCIGVYGPHAAQVLARTIAAEYSTDSSAQYSADSSALDALAPQHALVLGEGDSAITVIRSTDLGVAGFDCIAARAVTDEIRRGLHADGVAHADDDVAEVARIEAGVPQWGTEMDPETIPQEANLDHPALDAISFTKGCYTGQEVVARIHFRGHVNRHLRRLRSAEALPVGSAVHDSEGKEVGVVRSSAVSPALGAIALAMVRREIAPGSTVVVRTAEREVTALCEEMIGSAS